MEKKKYYQEKWFAILLLIFFAPVGIFLIYKYGHFKQKTNLVLSIIFGLFFLSVAINGYNEDVSNEIPKEKTEPVSVEVTKTEEEIKTEKLADAEEKAKKENEAKLKDEAEKKKKEEETAAKNERIKTAYLNEIKPEVDKITKEYDRIWSEYWTPTFEDMADGNYDRYTSYNAFITASNQYEALMQNSISPVKEMSKKDKKNLNDYVSNIQAAAMLRRKAVNMAADMIDKNDFAPSTLNKIQEVVGQSDSHVMLAIASLLQIELDYGIEM
jgi:hypothetical protein